MLHYHRRWCVSLPSSKWNRVGPHRYVHQANWFEAALFKGLSSLLSSADDKNRQFVEVICIKSDDRRHRFCFALGYMTKPFGQLVLVSFTHYCASTPSLSTWSSSRRLIGNTYLGACFALRCVQRLITSEHSYPAMHATTQQVH